MFGNQGVSFFNIKESHRSVTPTQLIRETRDFDFPVEEF